MKASARQKFSAHEQAHEMIPSEFPSLQNIHYVRNQAWGNWGKTAHCQPEFSFYPQRVEDLIPIIDFALERGMPVRVAASGHSWSELVPTDGILVFIHHLNKVTLDLSDDSHPLGIGWKALSNPNPV
jgi:FAD binding domain